MCPLQTNKDLTCWDGWKKESGERERERERVDKFLNQTCFESDFKTQMK